MARDYEATFEEADHAFRRVVWPAVRHAWGGGRIVTARAGSTGLEATIDREGGVDAAMVVPGQGTYTLALRVQAGGDYGSFTIRSGLPSGEPTEKHKRLKALDSGAALPLLTAQAYITVWEPAGEHVAEFLSAGLVETAALYNYVRRSLPHAVFVNPSDMHEFEVYWWAYLQRDQVPVKTVRDSGDDWEPIKPPTAPPPSLQMEMDL